MSVSLLVAGERRVAHCQQAGGEGCRGKQSQLGLHCPLWDLERPWEDWLGFPGTCLHEGARLFPGNAQILQNEALLGGEGNFEYFMMSHHLVSPSVGAGASKEQRS